MHRSNFQASKFSKPYSKKEKGPLPAFPEFQFYDNGEKPGRGKNQFTMTTEVYAGGHFNIMSPYWKRTVALLDPDQVINWAKQKRESGEHDQHHYDQYASAYHAAEHFMANFENPLWAKIGYFEDRRSHTRYPGQCMLVKRQDQGPMVAYLFDGTGHVRASDPIKFDFEWRPGTRRRLFYGWYDPNRIYQKSKERKAREEAYLEARRRAREADGGAEEAFCP